MSDKLAASPRLFKNDILDKLSRVHPLTPVVIYAPIIAGLALVSALSLGLAATAAWMLAGVALWSLLEYLGHRFLFHKIIDLPLLGRAFGDRLNFLMHGVHHEHPSDPLRLVMPPLLSGPIMLGALLVVRLAFGETLAWPVFAGFMLGYLSYDCVHYWVHHGTPKSRFGRHIRTAHMAHHFRDHTQNYGVLSVWWDYVFGTAGRRSGR